MGKYCRCLRSRGTRRIWPGSFPLFHFSFAICQSHVPKFISCVTGHSRIPFAEVSAVCEKRKGMDVYGTGLGNGVNAILFYCCRYVVFSASPTAENLSLLLVSMCVFFPRPNICQARINIERFVSVCRIRYLLICDIHLSRYSSFY